MNENEKPEIGTSEAAVLACVDLIARAVQVSEARVAYYLDLYYQLRSRYESEKGRASLDDIYDMLESISDALNTILSTPQPTGLSVNPIEPLQIRPVERITEADMAGIGKFGDYVEKRIEEAENRSKKKQRLTGADLRQVQKKAGADSGAGYQWRAYKRSVLQRLSEARARGVTSAEISAASEGKLTDNAVMDFLEAVFRPIDDYRALEAALDRLAEEK